MAPQQRKQSTLPAGYKEDMSKGMMLRFEDSLPRLPVPDLQATATKYLKSVHCLLNKEEYARTEAAVQEFVAKGGPGETLQQRLLERAARPEIKNWLAEWWDAGAYMEYRAPIGIEVSYFYSHRDDRKRRQPSKRAAAITKGAISFANMVNEKTLEPEYMRKLPIAMDSYKWMFNACRIPAKPLDHSVKFDYQENEYIVVVRKNQFWKLPYKVSGQELSYKELEQQFAYIYENAVRTEPVGVLTRGQRDDWTEARQRLLADPVNKVALDTIEAAAFVVCLDDAAPVTLNERARQYWHGDGCNRWFDKPVQFIVNDNGTSGFNGEHSMMDGTPTHRLNDWLCGAIVNNKIDLSEDVSPRSTLPAPTPIRFELTGENRADIAIAQSSHVKEVSEHELRVEAFQGYGKGLIKQFKCSPDAYVQMIIQLGYYKFYGKNRPTYESAATRRFQAGRTETCRSVSDESVAWCQAMQHPLSTADECIDLFRKALASQSAYIADASDGRGCDRHLYGLKKCIRDGEPVPAIFQDPAYSYSSSWFISSSQLSSEYYNGYGWAQVIPDGWGIAYMINENSIQFNIVSKGLGTDRMAFFLNEAACEMRDLMMPTVAAAKAKL